MIVGRKYFMMIILFIICITHSIAQTDYYYYKGEKIPLVKIDNKVCISVPKANRYTSERIYAHVKVLESIKAEAFCIDVISRSDFEKLASLGSWREDAKSMIVTSCYMTGKGSEVVATPHINLRLHKEEDIDLLLSYAEQYGLKVVRQDPFMPLWYILSITKDSNISTVECANLLWETGKFAASVPDSSSNNMMCSDDPLFVQQWGLHNGSYPGIDVSASSAWTYATGKNVKIAILDSGVDMNHTDLSPNISSLSFDTETCSSPSIVYSAHGTRCAGIAAAVKDNGIQIAGVAPEATIVSISNSMHPTIDSELKLADGIIWAYQNGVDIISNSWRTSSFHPAIDEAIQEAFRYGRRGKGCVVVFAAGNDGINDVSYPADCNDTILAVGAIDITGTRDFLSNYGSELDIVAPGVDILSTIPNNQTEYDSGTSMACAHVAGVAALILERNPELTVNQVNSIINGSAKKLPGVVFNVTKPDGLWNIEYGYGLVDAYSSVMNTPHVINIQNETITGTRIITADSIHVGKDVTDTKEYGEVLLGPGDITLKASYIEIKNSTTVPLGTILTIEN